MQRIPVDLRGLLSIVVVLLTTGHRSISAQTDQILLKPAFPQLSFEQLLDIQNAGDGSNRLFAVRKTGQIHVFENDHETSQAALFLDLSDTVHTQSEAGLIGLAFHPDYAGNGWFFVHYVIDLGDSLVSRISRFEVDRSDPNRASRSSETIILEERQHWPNHNGGQLVFGPNDGYLYIALGDGGRWADPFYNGQRLGTLPGSLLRIDVDAPSGDRLYGIPDENPYAGNRHYRQEIFASGLRNPWRFSIDPVTNRVWAGDMGQELFEEINIIEKGGNYGWRKKEGYSCLTVGDMTNPTFDCDSTSLIGPVWEYGHSSGTLSVTGGHVYRGTDIPELVGTYVFGDFNKGIVWFLTYNGPTDVSVEEFADLDGNATTFGLDQSGELYVGTFYEGEIFKFVRDSISSVHETGDHGGADHSFIDLPNPSPARDRVVVRYGLADSGPASLRLVDLNGEVVLVIADNSHGSGAHFAEFSISDLASGVYHLVLEADGKTVMRKLIVRR